MKIDTKKYRLLDNKDLAKASGGFAGKNTYTYEEYFEAGLCIAPYVFFRDCCRLVLDGLGRKTDERYMEYADKHVRYYKTHTPEEYIKYVQREYPEYDRIYKGWKIETGI